MPGTRSIPTGWNRGKEIFVPAKRLRSPGYTPAGMRRARKLTPFRSVLRGHLTVTLPALVIQATVTLALVAIASLAAVRDVIWLFVIGCVIAVAAGLWAGWNWWSRAVLRWRQWIAASGADLEAVEALAVRTGLVWANRAFERLPADHRTTDS
jgi:TRAP-type C4-dicarboxylate transport system permease small subunit